MDTSSVITQSVVIAHQDEIMEDVIKRMIEEKVSSILVVNDERTIVGIVTERDIVRKFTLLSKRDKLEAKVITVMTRPVKFVRVVFLDEDIERLHKEQDIRHFPVLATDEPTEDNLVGMLTSTDMMRMWFSTREALNEGKGIPSSLHRLALIMSHKVTRAKYKKIFQKLHCAVESEGNPTDLIKKAHDQKLLIVYDLDDDYGEKGSTLLTKALSSGNHVIFLTNRVNVASEFKKRLTNPLHHIMIKPLDISFLQYLLEASRTHSS